MFVATLNDDEDRIRSLVTKGFRKFRVNFARRTFDRNTTTIRMCRAAAAAIGASIEIMGDLPGQKFRCGRFDGGSAILAEGDSVLVSTADGLCTAGRVVGVDSAFIGHARERDKIRFGPDTELVVVSAAENLECIVTRGGRVYSRCGIENITRYFNRSTITRQDEQIIEISASMLDYLCVSFADTSEMIVAARQLVAGRCRLIAKLESPTAVADARAIARASDGIMLGRGDLANFLSLAAMNQCAADLSELATQERREIYLATDYFRDMAKGAIVPTSDELQDVLYAIRQKPTGIVLNETASSDNWAAIADAALSFAR